MRGGRREGAGRPMLADSARKTIACRVHPSTYDRLRTAADESGQSVGRTLDTIVEEFFKNQK